MRGVTFNEKRKDWGGSHERGKTKKPLGMGDRKRTTSQGG